MRLICLLFMVLGAAQLAYADENTARSKGAAQLGAELAVARVTQWNGQLKAVIALNPEWAAQAAELDREALAGESRGPLHGT
ncbi:MAG: hypothetical protein RQ826_17895, partial [Xanthomonadales bacterium]|nr:hypothetical protein [Xanthomonadales bacterium]